MSKFHDDVPLGRGRGRPPVAPELKRTAKLLVSFTAEEMARLMHVAADSKDDEGNPMEAREWARRILLDAAERGS